LRRRSLQRRESLLRNTIPGALNLTKPADLLAKLEHEVGALTADRGNSYAAINALRDAYHLREWIWHDRLEHDASLQEVIMGTSGGENAWNTWISQNFSDFQLIRLCNSSKHFQDGTSMRTTTHRGGFDGPVAVFDNPHSGFDDNGFHVQIDGGRVFAMIDLLPSARDFRLQLFSQFRQIV
jgi:hypothetical protein